MRSPITAATPTNDVDERLQPQRDQATCTQLSDPEVVPALSQSRRLVRFSQEWPRLFDEERVLLESALGPAWRGAMQHIGSTAVPGPIARPVIDVRRALVDQHTVDDRLTGRASGGFTLDASVRLDGSDSAGRGRLLRYCARPPFALNESVGRG